MNAAFTEGVVPEGAWLETCDVLRLTGSPKGWGPPFPVAAGLDVGKGGFGPVSRLFFVVILRHPWPLGAPLGCNLRYNQRLPGRQESEIGSMAKTCEICGKAPVVGRKISHAHNVSARRFEPNLQRVKALVNGAVRRVRVCTRCIRSNKVVKAA